MLIVVLGADGSGRPFNPVPKHPTKERIQEFLQGGVVFTLAGNDDWELRSDGTAVQEWTSAPGCKYGPVPYQVTSHSIRFNARGQCWNGDGSPRSDHPKRTYELEVKLVARDVMLFDHRDDASVDHILLEQCRPISVKDLPAERQCVGSEWRGTWTTPSGSTLTNMDYLVEIIPGAKDPALFRAVKERLGKIEGDYHYFEGPPAKTPRVESEIFYVGEENREIAARVALALAEDLGPLKVQPWPGVWDFDVVVVAGSVKVKAADP